jgi:hypothetical protein
VFDEPRTRFVERVANVDNVVVVTVLEPVAASVLDDNN